jgi:DNA transposition AAA+ family ATPase
MKSSLNHAVMDRAYTGNAPLRNLQVLDMLAQSTIHRADHLPGIVTFSGPSGFGKSTAAAYIAVKHHAYYIEVRSTWTKKAFLEAIIRQLGLSAMKTTSQMIDQISEELACSQNPLILDEFDHAVERNLVELVRDIYEQSKAPVILIGEERLPQKLQKWERFHGRIMDWAQAVPANLDDAVTLNKHYAGDVTVSEDLLEILVSQSRGSVRRIVTNLDRIASHARNEGLDTITADNWGNRPLHTSQLPSPRKF